MISLETIEREINEVEARSDTTYRTCERLAWLYIVRDHLRAYQLTDGTHSGVTQALRGSEFLELSSNVSYPALMQIINDHLEAIRVLYPKSYENLIQKIRDLR